MDSTIVPHDTFCNVIEEAVSAVEGRQTQPRPAAPVPSPPSHTSGPRASRGLVKQIVEILLQSRNVEEIYGDDNDLRRVIGPIIKKETGLENDMDREVRRHIKNFEEGTADFEIEYQKTMDRIRTNRGAAD